MTKDYPEDAENEPLWDDDAFRATVQRLAKARGRSLASVCVEAGLAKDYIGKRAIRSGRSIEAMMRIAQALRVSLNELIGGSDSHHDAPPTDGALTRVTLRFDITATLHVASGSGPEIPAGIDTMATIVRILEILENAAEKKASTDRLNGFDTRQNRPV